MNQYKKLINNSIVFTIGNFGSKIITFIMVPLYTYVLSTQEYGTVDLILVTVNLILPILTLQIGEGIIRFSIEFNDFRKRKEIFHLGFFFVLCVGLILCISFPILIFFNVFNNYLIFVLLFLFLSVINIFLSQFSRGVGKVKEFAINGILYTIVTVFSNIIFLVFLKLGIQGYIFSIILASFVSSIYLFINIKQYAVLSLNYKRLNINLLREICIYSLPLIPNGTMLWMINSSTRYFILFFIDASANGIFAVANKIPQILSLITNIFNQAWTLSAFEEYDSESKDLFYSNTLQVFTYLMFILASGILVILKPFIGYLFESSYFETWMISPTLLIASIYQSINAFIGVIYTSAKKTTGVFLSSFIGTLFSVLINIILIPILGLQGAGFGTLISYLVMCVFRYFDTKKYVNLEINLLKFVLVNIVYSIQFYFLFVFDNVNLFIVEFILFIFMLFINYQLIKKISLFLFRMFVRKRRN